MGPATPEKLWTVDAAEVGALDRQVHLPLGLRRCGSSGLAPETSSEVLFLARDSREQVIAPPGVRGGDDRLAVGSRTQSCGGNTGQLYAVASAPAPLVTRRGLVSPALPRHPSDTRSPNMPSLVSPGGLG